METHSHKQQTHASALGDLSEALKEATKDVHVQAENTEFMRNFQKGQVSLREFKLVMSSLYFIYDALEEEIERNKENPVYSPVYFPLELHRKEALEQDLKYFYGLQWRERILCPKSTKDYVDRLHYIGQNEPELLVAHAYTRYLGDLSGGQVLKKIAQKALQLPATGEGLAFFAFDNVTSATKFKQLYRSRMNSIEIDSATKEKILEEAKKSFLLNVKVFEELQTLSTESNHNNHLKNEVPTIRNRMPNMANGLYSTTESNGRSVTQQGQSLPYLRWILVVGCTLVALMGLYNL
ncbi:heme oxygenase 1 [Bombina bombina]|uniref:heme oxygenase 1 n=1 Tax=Bombina bombina TaxID=8345 RepID=UPI00235ACCA9|nr:heme oxygenase 1 [Bombina bombina]